MSDSNRSAMAGDADDVGDDDDTGDDGDAAFAAAIDPPKMTMAADAADAAVVALGMRSANNNRRRLITAALQLLFLPPMFHAATTA